MLLELLGSHGRAAGKHWEIDLHLSHQEFANLIGATRETITITLGQLQKERMIIVNRRRITVLDRERLAADANGTTAPSAQSSATRGHSGHKVTR
jgi:CRP/FNR family cyclic AMP-dependent transcriptional regulator